MNCLLCTTLPYIIIQLYVNFHRLKHTDYIKLLYFLVEHYRLLAKMPDVAREILENFEKNISNFENIYIYIYYTDERRV